jgi:hypothetical protein
MSDDKVAVPEEPSVEEKLEILNAQLGFLIQAVAELDQQIQQMSNFINFVFSITAQKETPQDDQPQS